MEAISQSTYREYISVINNRRNILYMWLEKALNGCFIRSLLSYCKLKGELEALGFVLSQYDT